MATGTVPFSENCFQLYFSPYLDSSTAFKAKEEDR